MMDKTSPASVSKVPSNQPIGSSSAVSIQTRTINTNKMSSIRAMINSFPIFLLSIASLSFSQETFEFNFSGSIQTWTVPDSGVFTIEAYGARGGNYYEDSAPKGAKMSGDFILSAGDILKILVILCLKICFFLEVSK